MKYSNNGYKTVGTSALKPQAAGNLVLVQGGRHANRLATVSPASNGNTHSKRPIISEAAARSFACGIANRFDPLPEPVSRPSAPSSRQELTGIVACMGCIAAVLLMATLFQALI